MRIPVFSVDPIESSVIKSGLKMSFETGLAAYLVAETLASEQLKLGMSAIIDAVSPVEVSRDMWRTLSKKRSAELIVIECVLDPALHEKRIEARVRAMHGIPEVTWADVEARRKEFVPWNEERLIVDTSEDEERTLTQALAYISSGGAKRSKNATMTP